VVKGTRMPTNNKPENPIKQGFDNYALILIQETSAKLVSLNTQYP
jgi:hypothetical protein